MVTERKLRPLGVSIVPCIVTLAAGTPALAQSSSPEDIASARALGTEGVRLADSGDCASALPKLEASERLYHAPTTLARLGECQVNLGRLVAGTENLNRVVRENLPPGAPTAFVAAQQRAAQVLASAQPRIGNLRIHVEGASPDQLAVTVDGAKVPSVLLDAPRATDPGLHEVKAAAPGYKTATQAVQLAAGAELAVSLRLEVDPNAAAKAPEAVPGYGQLPETLPTAPPAATSTEASPLSARSTAAGRLPVVIAFGFGGTGIAVGSIFGIMALGSKSSLDNACPSKNACPPSSESDIDALNSRATVSSIGFGVGVVGLAIGVVLFLTSGGGSNRSAATFSPTQAPVQPWLGMGTSGLQGTFE